MGLRRSLWLRNNIIHPLNTPGPHANVSLNLLRLITMKKRDKGKGTGKEPTDKSDKTRREEESRSEAEARREKGERSNEQRIGG